MTQLQELGVKCHYNQAEPEKLHYSISINPKRLKDPTHTKKYFKEIINGISKDASKKGGLDNLTLSLDKEHQKNLQDTTNDLLYTAKAHKSTRTNFDYSLTLEKICFIGGGIAGGLAGLIFGYEQMSQWATNAAEYMNNSSHLWAPITGLTQAGISILGTAATTAISGMAGAYAGSIVSKPYVILKTPLANKVENYRSLERALNNASEQSLTQTQPKPNKTE